MIKTRVSAIILNPNVLICIYSLSNIPKPRDMYIINTYNSRNLSLSLTVKKKEKKEKKKEKPKLSPSPFIKVKNSNTISNQQKL